MLTLIVPAKVDHLEEVTEALSAYGKDSGFSPDAIFRIVLATEEVFVNICKYAYPHGGGEVQIRYGVEDRRFIMEFSDSGIPFDINSLPDPDVHADIGERTVGGLGIFFVKKMMDDVQYKRENDKNVLKFAVKEG